MKPVRVLVVDDSATMRGLIANVLSRDPRIAVVGEACDPIEARAAIKALDPDVMTLDVEMPRMDGIAFLDKVMRLHPIPVIMVSSMTTRGAATAIEAMELGAVDCIAKPSREHPASLEELPFKVRAAARVRFDRPSPSAPRPSSAAFTPDGRPVFIGASTGGVEALIEIISRFPVNCTPTAITLHMPSPFTTSFARRLDGLTEAQVSEAQDGAPMKPGCVYLAPGGMHLEVTGQLRCRLTTAPAVNGHRPSVDVLFSSAARHCGARAVGVILTGMGQDGAAGLLAMRRAGARTLGQDAATSVVYGMPKAAFECGAVEKQVALCNIAGEALALTAAGQGRN